MSHEMVDEHDCLGVMLKRLRKQSLWPDVASFADQVGMSLGGYKKYEDGDRLPSYEKLQQIFNRARYREEERAELTRLWNQAKGDQVGVSIVERPKVGAAKLTARIVSETVYILKQAGIKLDPKTERVIFSRVQMILSATE
jgi:transcriptional regulator with XRE-family HTH domain